MNLIGTSLRQPVTVAVGVILLLLAGHRRAAAAADPAHAERRGHDHRGHHPLGGRQPRGGRAGDRRPAGGQAPGHRQPAHDDEHVAAGRGQHPAGVRRRHATRTPPCARCQRQAARGAGLPRERRRAGDRGLRPARTATTSPGSSSRPPTPSFDIRTLRDFAEDRIKPVLERVPGVSRDQRARRPRARGAGALRPDAAGAARDHGHAARRRAARHQPNVSAGAVADGQARRAPATASASTPAVSDVERTVVADTAGGPVLVRDVAEVVRDYKEPTRFVRASGQPVIAINAQREVGANVMEVMDGSQGRDRPAERARRRCWRPRRRSLGLNGKLYADAGLRPDDLHRRRPGAGAQQHLVRRRAGDRSCCCSSCARCAARASSRWRSRSRSIGAVVAMVALGRTHQRDQPGGHGLRRRHGGRQRDRRAREHLPPPRDGQAAARTAAYDGTREVFGRGAGLDADDPRRVHPDPARSRRRPGSSSATSRWRSCAAVALSLIVSVTVIPLRRAARLLRKPRSTARAERTGRPARRPDLCARRAASSATVVRATRICGSVIARIAVIVVLTAVSRGRHLVC